MMSRDRRIDLSYRFFTSKDLFISGLLCILALFLSPNLYFRAFLFVYFYFFTWIQGKRNSLVITLFITVSIVFFNLLIPYGKVLFRVGTFPVTQGALFTGLEKAITLEALIMLSRASIRSDLQLPWIFGSLIAESFRIFEELLANKKQFDWKKPIESIDTILLKLSEKKFLIEDQKTIGGTLRERAAGSLLLILQTALIWTIFFTIKH